MNSARLWHFETAKKKVLPLILNDTERVLERYPLLAGLAYRDYSTGVDAIADELAVLVGSATTRAGMLRILVRSTYTGEVLHIDVRRSAAVSFLLRQAITAADIKADVDVGGHTPVHMHWVLVQSTISEEWLAQSGLYKLGFDMAEIVIETSPGHFQSYSGLRHTLESLGVSDGITFELYGLPDTWIRRESDTILQKMAENGSFIAKALAAVD
jgi:hypothetical protein